MSANFKRQIAKDIKKFLEPEGASSSTTSRTESEVKRFIEANHKISIYEIGSIKDILEAHYSERTVRRLLSKVKRCVVWDASICNVGTQKLLQLFYENEGVENLITSLTFNELLNLVKANTDNSRNAKILVNCLLNDASSNYCRTVNLVQNNSYVDTQLIEFCEQNLYSLYTYDKCMALRAKAHRVNVQYLNPEVKQFSYTPNEYGKDILLDESVLYRSLEQIVTHAQNLGARKFLITKSFVDALESNKELTYTQHFIHFLLADLNDGNYSTYISEHKSQVVSDNEKGLDLQNTEKIANKYQAIIFTANYNRAFRYKCNNTSFFYIPSWSDLNTLKSLPISSFLTSNACLDQKLCEEQTLHEYTDEINCSTSLCEDCDAVLNQSSNPTQSDDLLTDDVSLESNYESAEDSEYSETPETNRFVRIISSDNSNVLCKLPLFNNKKRIFDGRKNLNEMIWALDANMAEINLRKYGKVGNGITIVHCINGLDGMYYINVYYTVNMNNKLCGNLIFSYSYKKEDIPNIPKEYKTFAERIMLMT